MDNEMKINHARIADNTPELRLIKMASLGGLVFENSSFLSEVCEVFDAKYTSKKTETRILSAWKFEVCGRSRNRNRGAVKSEMSCETHIEIPARWTQIGTVCASFYLKLLPIVNFEINTYVWSPCVCCPSARRAAANVYTMHGHSQRMRSATCIFYLCVSSKFLPHPCLLKVIHVSPDMFVCISHAYIVARSGSRWKVCSSKSTN